MLKVGSMWEEKLRPGHTVKIEKNTTHHWSKRPMVEYKHIGVHNVRAQRSNTISDEKLFLRRFVAWGD